MTGGPGAGGRGIDGWGWNRLEGTNGEPNGRRWADRGRVAGAELPGRNRWERAAGGGAVTFWSMWILIRIHGMEKKNPHLWISYKVQDWREVGGKSVPRGTLMWNGNSQCLVCVEKIFLEKIS